MHVLHEEMTVLKMNLLGGMYSFLGQDELAYCEWITLFPDEPSEDDLKEIAENDELWVSACEVFGRIVKRYGLNQKGVQNDFFEMVFDCVRGCALYRVHSNLGRG